MISEETRQKINQVASVCIRCRRCMKECIMLNRFAENPKALFQQYLTEGPENMDRRIAYSCNECSQCSLKCPKGLNLKAVFQSLKEDYAAENRGIVPLQALLPSELGQEKECSPQYCVSLSAGTGEKKAGSARYLFIPGKFPPEPILQHLQASLGKRNVEMLPLQVLNQVSSNVLSYLAASPSQILITACPSSFRALQEAAPDRKILFYWDLMQDLIGIPGEAYQQDASLHLHDDVGSSVRWVLDQLGCKWSEDPRNRDVKSADHNCRQVLGLLFSDHRCT